MTGSNEPAAMATHALTRRFGVLVAVDRLGPRVAPGKTFGLLGSNGARTSTVIKMPTTLWRPSAGDAEVAGADLRTQPAEVRRGMGYVPRMLSADGARTAREILHFSARLHGVPSGEQAARMADALRFMDLDAAAGFS